MTPPIPTYTARQPPTRYDAKWFDTELRNVARRVTYLASGQTPYTPSAAPAQYDPGFARLELMKLDNKIATYFHRPPPSQYTAGFYRTEFANIQRAVA